MEVVEADTDNVPYRFQDLVHINEVPASFCSLDLARAGVGTLVKYIRNLLFLVKGEPDAKR